MAATEVKFPPSVPRSDITPSRQMKPRLANTSAVLCRPAITLPSALTRRADALVKPSSEPRLSTLVPTQRTAVMPEAPTLTCPSALTAKVVEDVSPASGSRSCNPVSSSRNPLTSDDAPGTATTVSPTRTLPSALKPLGKNMPSISTLVPSRNRNRTSAAAPVRYTVPMTVEPSPLRMMSDRPEGLLIKLTNRNPSGGVMSVRTPSRQITNRTLPSGS